MGVERKKGQLAGADLSKGAQLTSLTDEQQAALRAALDTFEGCGLDKLTDAELTSFGELFALSLLDAEKLGYALGWAEAMQHCRDWNDAIIESQKLRRAHA